ncbi:MAG: hypothetical protein JWL71_5095 [Acidobacteria bacterium]|nr:hypothetical protein [Acidobacteriota bacterium]
MIARVARLTSVFWIGAASLAAGQTLPSEPIALADGRVIVSGDVSATYGSSADPGFFNYTDYDHSALRMLRVDVTAAVKAGPHFTLLGEIRSENLGAVRPYALYLRIRPWTTRDFDVQVGRVPPTFGAFARRTYANDNPLIGYPLAYQYLTTLRPDSLPAGADELLRKRSIGWLLRYSIGEQEPDHGVPLVSAFRWDTGVQAHATLGMVSATAAVTTGTISNPLFSDDNQGHQFAGRLELRPAPGLILGTSFARGAFIGQAAARAALGDGAGASFMQTAWGSDAEYSRDHYLLRVETIVSRWQIPIPAVAPGQIALQSPLGAASVSVEGRYKLRPDLYTAARYDHLGFSDLTGSTGPLPWDAPVTRVEIGAGYSIQRNLLLKGSFQHDHRDGGVLPPTARIVAAQLVFWF